MRLPLPDAGRLAVVGLRRRNAGGDGFGWWIGGAGGTIFLLLLGSLIAFVPDGEFEQPRPDVGIPLMLLGVLVFVYALLPMIAGELQSFQAERLDSGYRNAAASPHAAWAARWALHDPALVAQAGPLWRSYLVASQAWSIGHSPVHADQARARAVLLLELARVQSAADADRALLRAGVGVADTDDVERARHFLTQLEELR